MFAMFLLAVSLCLAASAFAAPATSDVAPEKLQPTVIPIVSQSDELELNGTYKFSYETGNGIKREETSYDKVVPKARSSGSGDSNEGGENDSGSDEIHVQIGSYSYTAPDGTVISVKYIADENGFRPIGDHIPRVPSVASSSSAEKSGRALDVSNSDKTSKAPAVVARIADTDAAQSEAQPSSLEMDKAVSAENNSTSSESEATQSGNKDTTTESVKDSESPSTTEATSSEQSTTESANSTKIPVDASTTQITTEEATTTAESSSETSTKEKSSPSTTSA